jgi:hypothetical protein
MDLCLITDARGQLYLNNSKYNRLGLEVGLSICIVCVELVTYMIHGF